MRHGVRWYHLAAAFCLVLFLSWTGLAAWERTGGVLLRPSVGTVATLVVTALVLVWAAIEMRRYVAGKRSDRISPQRARVTLVAAQAAAIGGAIFAGWYAAHALLAAENWAIPSQRTSFWWYFSAGVAALVLVGAGMFAQWACRVDPPKDDDPDTVGEHAPA